MPGPITLGDVERFFVDEAAMLDEWRLEEWLQLFTEDGCYLVPPLDVPDADHHTTLFLVADDRRNLASPDHGVPAEPIRPLPIGKLTAAGV